jgi:hypothetical protein
MRTILLFAILLSAVSLKAQVFVPAGIAGYSPVTGFNHGVHFNGDSLSKSKWSFNRYSGLSTSFIFSKAGSASVISAPMGLQVNRLLTNNLYAFANVTVAPAYVNFNRSFINNGFNKIASANGLYSPNKLGVYTAASMGLMYVNDARTFSISGSISVEKGSNAFLPLYPVAIPAATNQPKR